MRKKSHIALARYFVRQSISLDLFQHKKSFYLGSILPDLNPGMLSAPHEYETSYGEVKDGIRQLADTPFWEEDEGLFWLRLGVVLHYLADYFTYPHNTTYGGTLKDHCVYEGDMKYYLREYVRQPEAAQIFRARKYGKEPVGSLEELFCYIEESHQLYLQEEGSVENDCRWILEVCSCVLLVVLGLRAQRMRADASGREKAA